MIRDLRYSRRVHGQEHIADSADASLRLAANRRPDLDPSVLLYLPPARGNPYQSLLYRRAFEHGVGPVPVLTIDDVDSFQWPYRTIVHLHWTRQTTQVYDEAAEAEAAVDQAIEVLERSRTRGNPLVWTVHNVLPHECRHIDADVRFRQWLADHADVVHVLGASTVELTAPHYRLPNDERLIHVPHPSYVGVYPDYIGRDEARWELGLDPGDRVAVIVGSQRAHKGVDVLVEALSLLGDDWRVLVAGDPVGPADRAALVAMAADEPRLVICPRRIGADEMQLFHRAADVAVIPYVSGLNSGAALLALSFGLPLVASDVGTLPETIDDAIGATVPAGDGEALATTLEAVVSDGVDERRAATTERAYALRAEVISDRFFRAIDAVLAPSIAGRPRAEELRRQP